MLIDKLIELCDENYTEYGDTCGCIKCNHPFGQCSGNCWNCLYQIHYPGRFADQTIKKVYDCTKMLYHYVCQYSYIYSSEILYAFSEHKDFLSSYDKFHLMSIACGACPDLIALEEFCRRNDLETPISYRGYDINPLWNPIHAFVRQYCDFHDIKRSFFEKDVITYFKKYYVNGTNIIVISYLLSYLYNTNQTYQIDLLFESIADNVILRKDVGDKMLIIINDVNSNRRGRDYFAHLPRILRRKGLSVNSVFKHFNISGLNFYQRIGSAYWSKKCLFPIDEKITMRYHIDNTDCRSVQLIMEVM
jgi:hypothetical protein